MISPYIYPGLPGARNRQIVVPLVLSEVKRVFGDYDLTAPSRKRELVWARHTAAYLIKNKTDLSLSDIAELLGRKNHATILNSIKRVSEYLEYDKVYQNMFNRLAI